MNNSAIVLVAVIALLAGVSIIGADQFQQSRCLRAPEPASKIDRAVKALERMAEAEEAQARR